MSKNPENWWKSVKIANIDKESLHNFWTTWEISMKFWGKMWPMIILKVTKNVGFTLALEDTFFEEPHGGGGGQIDLSSPLPFFPCRFRVKEAYLGICKSPPRPIFSWKISETCKTVILRNTCGSCLCIFS